MNGVNAKVHIMESGKRGKREEEGKEVHTHTHTLWWVQLEEPSTHHSTLMDTTVKDTTLRQWNTRSCSSAHCSLQSVT